MNAFSAILAVLSVATWSFGQVPHGPKVQLTGSVIAIKNFIDPDELSNSRSLYKIELYLQFHNRGDRSVVLLSPTFRTVGSFSKRICLQKTIEFLSDGADQGRSVLAVKQYIGVRDRRRLEPSAWDNSVPIRPCVSFARSLGETSPRSSPDQVTVGPGAYHEFHDSIVVESGFTYDLRPGEKWKHVEGKSPSPEHPAFRVAYHLTLKDTGADSGLLETLQHRWRSFGHFYLDADGDFSLRSEPIVVPRGT